MVGGGNTALTDALYLDSLGAEVTIVHRRDAFRAEKYLQQAVERRGIPVIWNSVVEEIVGRDGRVTGVVLRDRKTGETTGMGVEGVFVAIGFVPNSKIAREIGVACDERGFIKVDQGQRTNIPRVYAAGDVTGGVMQIVTAVSEGARAALAAYEDLEKPYWISG
jgi:thioredoxin reductase (NADPH)